jgi:hypothetical protein
VINYHIKRHRSSLCQPVKVKLFGWQAFQNRMPAKENLSKRGIIDFSEINFVGGCVTVESTSHIFL